MLACTTAIIPRQREHSFVPCRVKSWVFLFVCFLILPFTSELHPYCHAAACDKSGRRRPQQFRQAGVVFGVPPLGSQCDGNHFHLCCFHARHMKGRPAGSDFLAFAFVSFRFSSFSNRETYIRALNVIVYFSLVRQRG